MTTGGVLANKQGRVLEKTVLPCLQSYGFTIIPYSKWVASPDAFGDELVLKNAPYTTIYGHKGYTEFLLLSKRHNLKVRIECKWQQSGGSVDEKLPYLYLNCLCAMPENEIIVVLGGGGMKPGAISWLKSAVHDDLFGELKEPKTKRIKVLTLDEFLTWANFTFGRTVS
jgi:hypothetical protein